MLEIIFPEEAGEIISEDKRIVISSLEGVSIRIDGWDVVRVEKMLINLIQNVSLPSVVMADDLPNSSLGLESGRLWCDVIDNDRIKRAP